MQAPSSTVFFCEFEIIYVKSTTRLEMTSIPASEICFLSGLPAKTAGQKVRFLGW